MLMVLMAFGAAFVIIPYFVLPRPKGARSILDVLTINLVRWMGLVIVGVHLMALFGIFELAAVLFLCAIGFYYSKAKPAGWTLHHMKEWAWTRLLGILDLIDRTELKYRIGRIVAPVIPRLRLVPPPPEDVPPRSRWRIASLAIVPVLVLGVSFWLRARYAMGHLSLSPPDTYHYMAWSKELLNNNLYVDGIYPLGIPSVLAFTSKMNGFASMLDVTRFMGPLIGSMIVYGIFYVVYRLSDNFGAATFAAGAFGLLGTRPEWHEPWFRQTGALPQELGLAIALMALPSAVMCVVDRERNHLWTIAAACAAIGLTHPVPLPLFVLLAVVGAFATALLVGGFKEAGQVSGIAIASSLASMSYLPLGKLAGLELFEPIRNLTPLADPPGDVAVVPLSVGAPGFHGLARFAIPALVLGIIGAVLLLVAHDGRRRAGKLVGLCAIAAVIVFLYDVTDLKLDPYYADRLAQVVGPSLAIVLGLGFAAVTLMVPRQRLSSAIALLAAGILGLGLLGRTYPASAGTHETVAYESTIEVTEAIAHEYERYTYTVVGTPQQRQVVLGDGWFIESWVFARDASLRAAQDPGYQMPARKGDPQGTEDTGTLLGIPTQDVFVFVEKVPFEGPRLAADGPTEEYYFDPVKRGRIMARIYLWAETYMRYHTDMSVFFEDEEIKVYRITRTPDLAGASDSPEFRDYTWLPGKLFNFGPTKPQIRK
jgi:hypothetical protein